MLARLLRILIVVQVLCGAGLGYLLARWAGQPEWCIPALAVLFPLATMLLVDLVSAWRARSGESVRLWWRALAGEFMAGLRIFLLRQPWTVHPPRVLPATGTQARVPVVLVHGYLCNHRVWDDVATTLRAHGHTVLAVNLEPLFTSIDAYAPILEAAVATLCQQTGARQVALVGHSMGGLAIRAWMRAHGSDRVARVLTLGTPHVGTRIEPRTRTPNGQQMQWQSPWLAELAAIESDTHRSLFRIALTPQDNIVFPQRAQVLSGIEPVVFHGIGHLQMCLDAAVIRWVADQLSEFTLAAPAA